MTLAERFWAKVDKNGPVLEPKLGPCWVWTAGKQQGYGRVRYEGKNRLAYVVSWILAGNKPTVFPETQLDHLCKNRACIRPSHLEVVNNKTNSQRSRKSTLNPELVQQIRRLYESGNFTYRSLAKHLKVGKGAVDFVLRGLTWNNVQPSVIHDMVINANSPILFVRLKEWRPQC